MSTNVSRGAGEHLALVSVCADPETSSPGGIQAAESARFALAALTAYGVEVGATRSTSVRELMADLVTDLMHLADRSNAVFDEVLDAAASAYLLDVRGPAGVVLAVPARTA